MATPETLKEIYLFKNFTANELNLLTGIASEKTYPAGQDIFMAGQEAKSLYVIRMGTVKIFANTQGEHSITSLGTGSHFGELPIVDQGKRSATAQAQENCTLLEIEYDKLNSLLSQNVEMAHKFYRELARYLAGRLRATTQDLSQIKDLKLKHF